MVSELHRLIHMLNDDAPCVLEAYAQIDGDMALVCLVTEGESNISLTLPLPIPYCVHGVYASIVDMVRDPDATNALLDMPCAWTRH